MNVLVINCGSSSLKYQLIDSETEAVLAKGLCERIGIDGRLVYEPKNGEPIEVPIYQSTTFYANWSESLIYRYVKPLIGLNCRSGAGSSYSIVTAFSCGTRLALDPNPTNGWYYSAANGC